MVILQVATSLGLVIAAMLSSRSAIHAWKRYWDGRGKPLLTNATHRGSQNLRHLGRSGNSVGHVPRRLTVTPCTRSKPPPTLVWRFAASVDRQSRDRRWWSLVGHGWV